jgi:hypothetical protein
MGSHAIAVILAAANIHAAEMVFEEVANSAGISYVGQSWGSSWGDFNDDGWPDIWTSNHARMPSLYLNMKNGRFIDIASEALSTEIWTYIKTAYGGYDSHGAAWADFDNDGDQDLVQLADGGNRRQPNHLYVNSRDEKFEPQEQAVALGIDLPNANSRTPLWFDWNNDGLLDLFTTSYFRSGAGTSPATLFQQVDGNYVNVNDSVGLGITTRTNFSFLSDLAGNEQLNLAVTAPGDSLYTFKAAGTSFIDETLALGLQGIGSAIDVISADLVAGPESEIFVLGGPVGNGVVQADASTIEASLTANKDEKGFSFQTAGPVTIELYPPWLVFLNNVYIGAAGVHPATRNFMLSNDTPGIDGLFVHTPGVDNGFYIGYDRTAGTWSILFSSSSSVDNRYVVVRTDSSVSNLAVIGFNPADPLPADSLLIRNAGTYQDIAPLSGIVTGSSGRNVAVGDFDNDMDQDLYIVATGPVENNFNLLYENLGDGFFAPVADAGGAAGTRLGRGDTVSVADYDLNGFLDLFVTNGKSHPPFDKDGPYQLFRNTGNSNHWIELDLEGVQSNRDGIGTRIQATAGGVTQVREQGGGMHFRTQNHQRIHFGLAGNTLVESVSINWPSGISQTINNLPADEIVHVLEPSFPSLAGKPDYQPGLDEGLYLWKDTFDGPYHIEANGSGPSSVFSVELITDRPIAAVTTRSFESNDSLAWSGSYLDFEAHVGPWFDGLDVQLPPGTNAMIAVEQDGRPNPRQLHIGASGQPLTPSGWIIEADTLPPLPAFQGGQDLGLFIGRNAANGEVRARWNGDGPNHRAEIDFLFSQVPTIVTPVGIEANDVFIASDNAISIDSYVGSWWDGANIALQPGTRMGLAYTQDGLVQPHRVNPATRNLGLANAYRLPRAEPYGKPDYDPGAEAGLYLWQDKATGVWHLRGAAGGGGGRYTGEVVSDQPFTLVSAFSLESNDVLDTADPRRIVFDLGMWKQWEDGIDFQAAPGAQLTLNLTSGNPFGVPGKAVRIGEMKWPVDNLPLNLGGW